MTEYPDIKYESFDDDVKKRKRKKHYCPYCGNEMTAVINGHYAFCDKCHRRMPWTVSNTSYQPVKECKL